MLVLGVISRYSGIWWLLVQNVRLHLANIYASVAMWLYRWQLVVCWVHACYWYRSRWTASRTYCQYFCGQISENSPV